MAMLPAGSDFIVKQSVNGKMTNLYPYTKTANVFDVKGRSVEKILSDLEEEKGAPNGIATLDENGKIVLSQLQSYIDDVTEDNDDDLSLSFEIKK